MSLLIFLDTGPLSLAAHPKADPEAKECAKWLFDCLAAGARVCIPEVCDYEVRRELLRLNSARSIRKLDDLQANIEYVPIKTKMMLRAAELWADSRKRGKATADPKELDVDVVLAAQALLSTKPGEDLVIATTNVGHLGQFATAKRWRDIPPP